MRTRFYNGYLITMEDGAGVTGDELWVSDDKVEYVGPPKQSAVPFDREIDLDGNLLLPGFKNAHTHSAMTFLRSYADDLPLHDWLEKQVFPMEAKLDAEMVYHLCKLAIMEYLTSGITANFDMYPFPAALARASADCGFRTVVCGSVNNFVSSVEACEADYKTINAMHPLVSFQLGFHAEYTTSREILADMASLADSLGAPVYCHLSETKAEVEECLRRNGKTPPAYLRDLGIFRHGGGGFHCVHVTDEDRRILAESGVWAVTCPASNLKLASGIAPLVQLAGDGVGLAVGTDGPASNNCLDMFREMFLCTGLQKVLREDAAAMAAEDVLHMATTGGARAMGLADCDCLAPGKQADLTVLDLHRPNMQPPHNLAKNIVYAGSKQNVKLTMVAGRILYENGVFQIGTDSREVYAQAAAIVKRLEM